MNYSELSFDTFSVQDQNNMPQVNTPPVNNNPPQIIPVVTAPTVPMNNAPMNNAPMNNAPMNNMDNRNMHQMPSMNRLDSMYNNSQQQVQMTEQVEEAPKSSNVKLIQLGIILMFSFLTALSWNEAIRYYIGRSIKFYSGKPILYIYYASTATILMCLSYLYSYLK